MTDLCEFGGCVDTATWRVEATTRRRNWGGPTDIIRCCDRHADLLSAQHETGPKARVTVTRERLVVEDDFPNDAAL